MEGGAIAAQQRTPSRSQYRTKAILALDGGGIRGVLTLEYLEVIEALLRQLRNNPNLLLSDYFDLIGGTSTGSIIAAGLACGMSVKDIKSLYYGLGAKVFVPTGLGLVVPKFQTPALQKALDGALGADTTLDSDKILTGLMIMTKRLDTGSPWPLTNGGAENPRRRTALSGSLRSSAPARPRRPISIPSGSRFRRATARWSMANSSMAASARSTIQRCNSSCWRR